MSSRRGEVRVLRDAQELAQAKWEGSGLTDEHARKLQFEALDSEETGSLGSEFHPTAALKIPYFDLKGNPTKFFRVRYLAPLPGFAGLVEKPQRYAQPKGTLNEIYFPPLLDRTWEEIAEDTSVEVWITEGELKAAAACAKGIACIGLGGVDVWQARTKGFDILPGIDPSRFRWVQRHTNIAFDSDAATKPTVLGAQLRLCKRLHGESAICHIVGLPEGPGGEKVGLDDYLLTHTIEDLKALAAQARPYAASAALWDMNEKVIALLDPSCVWDRKSGKPISTRNFKELNYAHHHFNEVITNANGSVQVKVRDTAVEWLRWGGRFELDGMVYAPGKPEIVDRKLNLWKGWGVPAVKGDMKLWDQLMEFIFRGDKAARTWFERWCAYPIQYPGTKLYTAVVFWGAAQGTGKSLAGEIIGAIYGDNYTLITNKDLTGGFNSWAEGRQFVSMDEITGGRARADADYIKGLITQHLVRINKKYVAEYTLEDCINYFATSNHPDSFFVEDEDRRMFVQEVLGPPLPDEFYARFRAWKAGPGPSNLRYYLEHLDLGDFNPQAKAMVTQSKLNMIEDARSDLSSWVALLRRDPDQALARMPVERIRKSSIFTAAQLLLAYDPEQRSKVTANGMGKELKRQGIRLLNGEQTIKTAVGTCRLYAVRDMEYWLEQDAKTCADHYNQFFATAR